ncbi:MAG: aminoacyl-tRNA hydrolase [Bacteroidales bacterium]|nr:aminoacyl-tRNA hydrolase [Bacteroidales bacterium]
MNYLIVGLGNIGAEYASTRHNMGFMVLDALAGASNIVFQTERYGDIATFSLKGRKVTLLKPSTYVNLSGKAVRYWMEEMNVPMENLLVVLDDIAIPFGTIRMRKRGSDGGHNGLKSIDYCLISDDYARLRIGLGHGFGEGGQIDFVLGELIPEEKEILPEVLSTASEAIKSFVLEGVDNAMNKYNTKRHHSSEDHKSE